MKEAISMAFDGMVTTAVVSELNDKLLNGKIDKIYQPAAEEIILNIHCGREKYRTSGKTGKGI